MRLHWLIQAGVYLKINHSDWSDEILRKRKYVFNISPNYFPLCITKQITRKITSTAYNPATSYAITNRLCSFSNLLTGGDSFIHSVNLLHPHPFPRCVLDFDVLINYLSSVDIPSLLEWHALPQSYHLGYFYILHFLKW